VGLTLTKNKRLNSARPKKNDEKVSVCDDDPGYGIWKTEEFDKSETAGKRRVRREGPVKEPNLSFGIQAGAGGGTRGGGEKITM